MEKQVQLVPIPATGTVYMGMGMGWDFLTRGLPMPNPICTNLLFPFANSYAKQKSSRYHFAHSWRSLSDAYSYELALKNAIRTMIPVEPIGLCHKSVTHCIA